MKENHLQALKIFAVLFLVFTVFGHWIGDNDDDYIDLTASIAEEGTLSLEPNRSHLDSEDMESMYSKKAVNGSRKYFTTKAPLSSFLALPSYVFLDIFNSNSYTSDFYLDSFKQSFNEKVSWSRYFGIVSVSSLSGALTGVLIFLIFQELGSKKIESTLAGIAGPLSTLVFPYSTTMHGIMLGTFFFTLAVFMWIKSDYRPSKKQLMVIAGSLGFGISSSYFIAFPGTVLAILLAKNVYSDSKEEVYSYTKYGTLGLLIGLLPIFIYNILIFGNPLNFFAFYLGTGVNMGPLETVSAFIITGIRSLIGPLKGLFIYSPVLLFGFYGLRKTELNQNIRNLIIGSFVVSIAAISLNSNWLIDTFYGAIYLLPVSVLLLIPSFKWLFENNLPRKLKYSFVITWVFSVISMLSSTQPWRSVVYSNNEMYIQEFLGKIIIQNDLLYYITNIFSDGFRSPILSYISGASSNFDPVLSSYPFREIVLTTQINSITLADSTLLFPGIICLIGLIMFRNEIIQLKNDRIFKTAVLLVIIVGVSGFSQNGTFFNDFYQSESSENIKWGHNSPEILFYNKADDKRALIKFSYRTLGPSQELNASFNGERILNENVNSEMKGFSELVELEIGLNRLEFGTSERCRVAGKYYANTDTRCVSVGITDSAVIFTGEKDLYNGKNVFGTENGYNLRGNSTFYIEGNNTYSLKLDARSIGGRTNMNIYRDGELLDSTTIDSFGSNYSTPYFKSEEFSKITVETDCPENCENIEASNIELLAFEKQAEDDLYNFGKNWYNKIQTEKYRWSTGNSSIYLFNYGETNLNKYLWLNGRSFGQERNLTFKLNQKILDSRVIQTEENKQRFNIRIEPGINSLKIESDAECSSMGEINENNDIRCSLYGLERLYLTDNLD